METQIITTPDNIDLFVRVHLPDAPETAPTIYWVHGLGEHGGRYEHVADTVSKRGWRVVIPDLRGHGRSTGVRTHVISFDQYVDDIELIWNRLQLGPSTVLLGHSMGGLIAVRTVQSGRITPSALALSSPLLGVKVRINPLTILMGRLLIRMLPAARFSNGVDPTNMTHDVNFTELRRKDRLINKTVTAGWFFAMRSAVAAANRDVSQLTLPVCAFQGSADRTTDPGALFEWWERIPSKDKELFILEDHFHELFFEPDWPETTHRMLDWLDLRERVASEVKK